jgi:tetratricopeptide (TPR) repeat protein
MKRSRKAIFLAVAAVLLCLCIVNFDDWRVSRQLAIARSALQARDPKTAMNALGEAARLSPANGEVHFWMARVYRRQGDLQKVRQSLEKAARYGIALHRIRREEWLAMAQAGQMREAAPHLRELLVDPGDDGPEICEAFVNGYFVTYQLGDAFRILEAWEKDFPQDPQPLVFRAAFSAKTDSWTAAVGYLRQAMALAPQRDDIQRELANGLLNLRETAEAEKLFQQLLKSHPEDPELLVGWVQILLERGNADEARSSLNRILQTHPQNFVALRTLGQLELNDGHTDEAVRYLEMAVKLKSYDTEVRYTLGTAFQKMKRSAEAREQFDFVAKSQEALQRVDQLTSRVRVKNDDLEARFEIAELLREYGEPKDRLLWLRSIVALDPSYQPAHRELAKYYAESGNAEESAKHSNLAQPPPDDGP